MRWMMYVVMGEALDVAYKVIGVPPEESSGWGWRIPMHALR